MSTHSPSPNRTTQRRRRDGLLPLVLIALLLAVLPVGCVAEVALRLVTPQNDPFKDVGSSTGLGAYKPFPPGISYAAVDPDLGNLQETEIARRDQTPIGVSGAVTIAPLAQVPPAIAVTVPPTPTNTSPPTPRPTVTPATAQTDVAGGVLPSPTPTEAVVVPGSTTTPGPTNTSTPTRTPTLRPETTPTVRAAPTQATPSVTPVRNVTPSATVPIQATPSPTISAPATPSPTISAPATPSPTISLPATPSATAVVPVPSFTPSPIQLTPSPTQATPTATLPIVPTPTQTQVVLPATPTQTDIPVEPSATPTPTRTDIPVEPSATPTPTQTDIPVEPSATPTPTITSTPTSTATPTATPTALPELRINPASIGEGDSSSRFVNFTVTLSEPAGAPVTVSYNTIEVSGGASEGLTADYQNASGILTFNPGETSRSISVVVNGDTIVESDEIFNVELSAPFGATLATGSARGTIVDNDIPVVSIVTTAISTAEGDTGTTAVSIVASLASPAERLVTVNFRTLTGAGDTASGGADYQVVDPGTAIFAINNATTTLLAQVNGDVLVEPDETFTVELLPTSGVTLGTPTTAEVTITDDDDVTLNLAASQLQVDEGGPGTTTPVQVDVTLSQAPTVAFDVQLVIAGGSASLSEDFTFSGGTLSFTPGGPLTQSRVMVINGDDELEGDESITLRLQGVTPADTPVTIGTAQQTITIVRDDLPTITVSSPSEDEGDSTTSQNQLVFDVSLSGPVPFPVSVNYSTRGNTANDGEDYRAQAQTLTFAPEQTTQQVPITIEGDVKIEPDETLFLELSGASGGLIAGSGRGTGTIRNDDATMVTVTKSGTALEQELDLSPVTWRITVAHVGASSDPPVIVDVVDALPSSPTQSREPSFSPSVDDYDPGARVVTWSGHTLSPGESVTFSATVFFTDPVTCTRVVNPSYRLTVDGITYEAITGRAPVDIGSGCGLRLVVPPLQRVAPTGEPDADKAEPTSTATATLTAAPTGTSTVAPTSTPAPTRTSTPEPTETPKPEPTETPRPAPTRTSTPEPEPTDTPKPAPTSTTKPTDTPEPAPTSTTKPTSTPKPTETRKPEPTNTPRPAPTSTTKPTSTPEPTFEPTPVDPVVPTSTPDKPGHGGEGD